MMFKKVLYEPFKTKGTAYICRRDTHLKMIAHNDKLLIIFMLANNQLMANITILYCFL